MSILCVKTHFNQLFLTWINVFFEQHPRWRDPLNATMTARANVTYCEQTRAPFASNVSSMPGENFLRIKGNVTVLPFSSATFNPSHCRAKRGYLSSSEFPTTSRWFRPKERLKYPKSYYWEGQALNIHEPSLRYWSAAGPRQQSLLIFTKQASAIGWFQATSESVKNGLVPCHVLQNMRKIIFFNLFFNVLCQNETWTVSVQTSLKKLGFFFFFQDWS